MNLELRHFKDIDLADPFFNSLKSDYREFPAWFAKKAQESAYVFQDAHGTLEGFLYLKIETGSVDDVIPPLPSVRRIKIGTIKINPHGTKLGERFLKKIFDHAISSQVKEIYVTVFANHSSLINLFERYGFQKRAEKITQNGTEQVLVRVLHESCSDVIKNYPLVCLRENRVFLLSLYPEWHTRLLPDSILNNEDASIVEDVSHTNSIHKVYLAKMKGMETLRRGDVILIYRTTDNQGPAHYRSVATSIGVIEEYRTITTFQTQGEFLDYCNPYSIFSADELNSFWANQRYPHIIRFTYNMALKKRVTRAVMIEEFGINGNDYWGFKQIDAKPFMQIAKRGLIDENLIIY